MLHHVSAHQRQESGIGEEPDSISASQAFSTIISNPEMSYFNQRGEKVSLQMMSR